MPARVKHYFTCAGRRYAVMVSWAREEAGRSSAGLQIAAPIALSDSFRVSCGNKALHEISRQKAKSPSALQQKGF